MDYRILNNDELMHYGVKGMQWGVRNREKHTTGYAKPGSFIKRKRLKRSTALKTNSGKDKTKANKEWKVKKTKYIHRDRDLYSLRKNQQAKGQKLMEDALRAKQMGDTESYKVLSDLAKKYLSASDKNKNLKRKWTGEYEDVLTIINKGAKRSGIKRKHLSGRERTK